MNESLRQILGGLLLMLLMGTILIGAVLTAGVEGDIFQITPSQEEITTTMPETILVIETATLDNTNTPTAQKTNLPTQTSTPTPIFTMTPTATPTNTSTPQQTPTLKPTVCIPNPPFGWIRYIVQPDDTLSLLSRNYHTSVNKLKDANCKWQSSLIFPEELLWVPNVVPITPTATNTSTTVPVTNTPVPAVTSTPTPTNTPVGTETATQTSTPTSTATETTMPTETSTQTPLPTDTPQPPTETPIPTATETSP